jgi:23S rRNA (pseudouridine1915-N3)-methyltransferase
MIIHLIAIGDKMPAWISQGYAEYAKRLPHSCQLRLSEIPPGKRGKQTDLKRIVEEEGRRMLNAVPKNCLIIALEVNGKAWSTAQLSENMHHWLHDGRDIALLVGGPEGLSMEARQAAQITWSLSPLTLPHPLVRVIVSEQIYRAWSLLNNHPYHR